MLKVENIDVYGFEAAIRGMRNPLNSWAKSDSHVEHGCDGSRCYAVGENDMELMRKLCKAGTEHRKYLRMITVTMDITAPLYWWKEFDTYKVGTVANSCSTMHKIAAKEFTLDDFSHEHLNKQNLRTLQDAVTRLNDARAQYLATKSKDDWWQMIQLLPSSYNQRRTVQINYEVAITILLHREGHKLDEWPTLCDVLIGLPYLAEIKGHE